MLKGDDRMEIRRQLYEAYCEGLLSVEPPLPSAFDEGRLHRLKESLGITGENEERFDNVFAAFTIDAEKRGFYAGLKVVLRLLSE